MVETVIFFKGLGVAILIVALLWGFGYWMYFFVKKSFPDLKYQIKYKILRKKYDEGEVAMLLEDLDAGIDEGELFKVIILSNQATPDKAKELIYIYKELKKLKGGNVK